MLVMLENDNGDVLAVNPSLVAALMGGGNYGDGIDRTVVRFASGNSLTVKGTVVEITGRLRKGLSDDGNLASGCCVSGGSVSISDVLCHDLGGE